MFVEQANSIVEKINFATEDYWGDKQRFKFRTSISDYSFQTEVSADTDRVVKTTFSMMVFAYLLPDRYENYKSVVQKAFTPRKVVFDAEAVGPTPEEASRSSFNSHLTRLNGNVVPLIDDTAIYEDREKIRSDWKNSSILEYQNFMATKTGSLLQLNDGSGSSVYEFVSTSFNTSGTTSDYQKFMLFIDDKTVPMTALSYYTSGSSLIAKVINSIAGFIMPPQHNPYPSCPTPVPTSSYTISTSSLIMGYGNIS